MKKGKRKVWTSVAALGMVGMMVFLTVYHTVSITALAKETLPGVEKIIKKNAPNAPFKILEIVPEVGGGEIGLYIKGQEGFNLSEDLKKLPTKADRAAYIANLTARLKEISSSLTVPNAADVTPLLYETYQEEYFPESVTGWNKVELADGKSETVRMNGQYVVAAGAKGNYTQIPAVYVPVAEGSGTHRENISGFTLPSDGTPTPYSVTFSTTSPTDPKLLSLGAYEPIYRILDEELVASLDAKTPVFLYKNDTNTYEMSGSIANCRPAGPGESPKININMGDYYYVAGYQYVDPANMQPSITYYYVQKYRFEYNVGTGQYNPAAQYQAIIKPGEERYSLAPSNPDDPAKKLDANFKSTGVTYEYTPGTGNYNFEQKAGTDLPVDVQVKSFYYKGGYTNHEWFKRYILDMDQADLDAFKVEVVTATPKQLHEKMYRMVTGKEVLQNYDLIYLSGKSRTPGITYGVGNDSSVEDADTLLQLIAREQVPLILDWQSLFKADASLNIGGRLAMLGLIALQPDLPSLVTNTKISVGKIDEITLSNLWNNRVGSQYQKNHLVNQNVYCFDRSNGGDLVQNNLCAAITDQNVGEAFQSVKAVINSENEYRANLEGKELLDETISKAAAIRHILNYRYGRNTTPKTAFRILEIEPCANYKINEKEILTAEKVLGWMGIDHPTEELKSKTVIDRMTTAEFIGKIDDLNGKYDMIYIGMNTTWMNTDAKGETQYNDSNMNGLVYTNVGDVTLEWSLLLGQLYSDYVNTNSTANWTSEQIRELDKRYLFNTDEVGALRTQMVDGKLEYRKESRPVKIRNIGDGKDKWWQYNKLPNTATYPKNSGIFRYSGNDITKGVRDKLLNYADAGYPIVFGDGFMSDITSTPMVINEHKIDNSSYLYEFAKTALDRAKTAKRENLLTDKQLTEAASLGGNPKKRELFAFYMNVAKPKLNVEMTGGHLGNGADEQPELYYLDADRGEYYLRYHFSITDEASLSPATTTYNCKLYLDINADGQFADARGNTEADAKTEELSDILIRNVDTDSMMLPDEHGAYDLSAGVSYQLERVVPKGFRGALPWKLEILRNNMDQTGIVAQRNAPIRGAASGYACIKETTEKPKISVLQIYHTQKWGSPYTSNFYLGTDPKQKTAATDQFWQYIQEANLEFDIEIEAYNTEEYEKKYKAAKAANTDLLAGKDMLIIGFADVFSEIDNRDGAVDGILNFIESGKSVLFAHDTTSFVNTPLAQRKKNQQNGALDSNMQDYWGYNFNMKIRDVVGMDRYGISNTELSGLRDGKILNPKDGLWKKIDTLEKEKAYVARSKRTQTYPEVQGYTYQTLNAFKNTGSLTKLNLSSDAGLKIGGNGSYAGEGEQMHVTQVNAGQITTYPFKIPERFPVSLTHSQYYQLDLNTDADRDGKSDIVVWYCLGDVTKKGSPMKNVYSASPNDVRNNYYIYSNRNVMYTGVGHSEVGVDREFEIKLFINTIVASYHTGISAPRISIIDNSDIRSAEVDNQYLIYEYGPAGDAETTEGLDSSLDIYYKVADDNLVGEEKRMEVKYEYLADAEKAEWKGLSECKTYSMTTGEEVSASETLHGSQVYKVTLPDIGSLLGAKPSVPIRITVTSKFNNYGDPVSTSASDVVTISRSDLFNLE